MKHKIKWTCFEDCCYDSPCDACMSYGEIQPTKEDLEKVSDMEAWMDFLFGIPTKDEIEKYEKEEQEGFEKLLLSGIDNYRYE